MGVTRRKINENIHAAPGVHLQTINESLAPMFLALFRQVELEDAAADQLAQVRPVGPGAP